MKSKINKNKVQKGIFDRTKANEHIHTVEHGSGSIMIWEVGIYFIKEDENISNSQPSI